MGSTDHILAEDLPDIVRGGKNTPAEGSGMLQDAVQNAKRSVVRKAFELANQDHNEAARLLGVHPNYLYRLLRSMGE
jgi:transcriptional regulator with PAS, ATPase and Fis domain